MRVLANILIVLFIGFSLGGLTANYSIQRSHGIGAVNVGPWSAWPFVGGSEADPYTTARAAADGTIALGAAEGLAFEAAADQAGNLLRKECRYIISGTTPAARLWTLTAYEETGELVNLSNEEKSAVFSGNILRFPDSSFEIDIGDVPVSGNWLPIEGEGSFKLVLRLYDTPITSNAGLIEPIMPSINLEACN